MNETQRDRLLKFIKHLGVSNSQFERMIGASAGTIGHLSETISARLFDKIRKAFPNLNAIWLLTGAGEMTTEMYVVNNAQASGGSAASIYGDASVGDKQQELQIKKLIKENKALKAQIASLTKEKEQLYQLLMKK